MNDWLQLIISILSGLTICIPLVVKLVQTIQNVVKEKNWNILIKECFNLMAQAEKLYSDGATKKEWVMAGIETVAKSVNYNYDDLAKQQISDLIDKACAMAKKVNTESK